MLWRAQTAQAPTPPNAVAAAAALAQVVKMGRADRVAAVAVAVVSAVAALATPAAAQTEALSTVFEVFIGLGANLGDAQATVNAAITQIAALPQTRLLRQSSLYKTAPVDAGGDDYINAVVAIATALSPLDLLHSLQHLEHHAGRQRPYWNAPRTLDIDILLYGDLRLESPELTLPHPRMGQRAFVLLPLAQIAPGLVAVAQLDAIKGQRVALLDPSHSEK